MVARTIVVDMPSVLQFGGQDYTLAAWILYHAENIHSTTITEFPSTGIWHHCADTTVSTMVDDCSPWSWLTAVDYSILYEALGTRRLDPQSGQQLGAKHVANTFSALAHPIPESP